MPKLSPNEFTTITLAFMAGVFGLAIYFLPDNKASLYIAVPSALAGTAATYLGSKKNDNEND